MLSSENLDQDSGRESLDGGGRECCCLLISGPKKQVVRQVSNHKLSAWEKISSQSIASFSFSFRSFFYF